MRLLICLALCLGLPAIAAAQAPAPVKPYAPPPAPMNYAPLEPSFETFRGQLRDIVKRKDTAALRPHVIGKGFFWDNDGYRVFEPKKPSFHNLVLAYDFDNTSSGGWDSLNRALTEMIATWHPKRKGVLCLPARPPTTEAELTAHAKRLGINALELVYPRTAGVPVYDKAEPGASVVETVGAHYVRKLDWVTRKGEGWTMAGSWIEIVTPAGKRAFAAPGTLDAGFHTQTCFAKDAAGAWKIAGTAPI
jgi:hypothetical protein